jgi:SAM-dependent methyltransferase
VVDEAAIAHRRILHRVRRRRQSGPARIAAMAKAGAARRQCRTHAETLMPKLYDRRYFDHWYRHPAQRVSGRQVLQRKVRLALAMAEYYLGRPVRSVLDVGCGEGAWRAPLLAERPALHYRGIDPSEYAVRRFGRARNLQQVRFGQLEHLRFGPPVDLLVCSDVMHYVPSAELRRGLSGFGELCAGVAFLEVFTREDDPDGDREGFIARRAAWYREAFSAAGFRACGSHGWLAPALSDEAAALERADRA